MQWCWMVSGDVQVTPPLGLSYCEIASSEVTYLQGKRIPPVGHVTSFLFTFPGPPAEVPPEREPAHPRPSSRLRPIENDGTVSPLL